jgi:hypothetical protein
MAYSASDLFADALENTAAAARRGKNPVFGFNHL